MSDTENQLPMPLSPRSPAAKPAPAPPARTVLTTSHGKHVGLVYVTWAETKSLQAVRALMVEQLGEERASRIAFVVNGAPITQAQELFEPFSASDTASLSVCTVGEADAGCRKSRKKKGGEGDEAEEAGEEPAADKKAPAERAAAAEKQGYFKASRKQVEVTNCQGAPTGELEEEVTVRVLDGALKEGLRRATGLTIFYEAEPTLSASALLPYLGEISSASPPGPSAAKAAMGALGEFLSSEFASIKHKMDEMIAKGVIAFDCLWYLFGKGSKFVSTIDECLVGSVVDEQHYQRTFFSNDFIVSAQLVRSNGRAIGLAKRTFTLPAYRGVLPISELLIRPIKPEEEAELAARGKVFREHAVGVHYASYAGAGFRKSWFCTTRFKADGRVVVDGANFARFNPNYNMGFSSGGRGPDGDAGGLGLGEAGIDEQMLWRCWHSVHGFSLAAKKWLELRVDGLSAPRFDDDAYERLVLSEERKGLVKALVTQGGGTRPSAPAAGGAQPAASGGFSDIISGKGGGCIFLLHGTPGTGKTLTAEAIAELLHRPLYSVGVGELGVSCSELEEKLREILEVASAWDAVVLIDEADIFLERRGENDIHRNAMVGVFLRLLEYHQGVLFLTTNRVRSFDEAFHSRISVALKYEPLGASARAEVWTNLLAAAGVVGLAPSELAAYELNGRQIKNTIRLAQSLAASEGVAVSAAHVARTVGVTAQFQEEIKEEARIEAASKKVSR